ncbi:hypothetical protein [Aquimarina algiphila]|uniref:hypothetical protein n=1 Tax=Aquimarina algiphila TaxID=2047982 RepID=UPI002493485E|nr:hypothetical protein [Aquimarina algiphila]
MLNKCPVCENVITGRSDKKYCSGYCKSAHQYEKRKQEEGEYYKIDRQLKTNRKILKAYNKSGLSTVRKEKLLAEGFNPKYFTHYWKNKKGQVYLFCYEYGFLLLKENQKEKYILVKWQKYMEV